MLVVKRVVERKTLMLNKVSLSPVRYSQARRADVVANTVQKSQSSVNFAGTKTSALKLASAYQALYGIKNAKTLNFTGAMELNDFEKSIITPKEIRIPNLLEIPENIDLPLKKMPKGYEKLNAAGLNVIKESSDDFDNYSISNDKGNVIFVAKVDRNRAQLPVVTYKQGKFMPEITVKDPSLGSKAIKMFSGSQLIGDGFSFKMPGQYEPVPNEGFRDISFGGRTVITTLNKEPRTTAAVNAYVESGLQKRAIRGDYADLVEKYDPTVIIPAGGFGERFFNITREYENKPSAKLPTDDRYRIIGTTLNLAASAGVLRGENDDVKYLSQNHEIKDGAGVYYVSKYKTDGGAIAEGLSRDIIRNDRDAVILNADIFTNADISRTYKALKTLPDAALVIPYYPVNAQRAKSFGLLGIEEDENGNLQIKEFLEKPQYTSDAPMPNEFTQPGKYDEAMEQFRKVQSAINPKNEHQFLANPGMYFLSDKALKVLMAQGILTPGQTGLGANVMPKIVELANEGRLLDEKGNKMKVYTTALEAKGGKPAVWDDIGTAEAYLKLIKDVANEVRLHGTGCENKYYGVPEFVLYDFAKNVDLQSGIVFDSQSAKDSLGAFCEKYGVADVRGNIYISGH